MHLAVSRKRRQMTILSRLIHAGSAFTELECYTAKPDTESSPGRISATPCNPYPIQVRASLFRASCINRNPAAVPYSIVIGP